MNDDLDPPAPLDLPERLRDPAPDRQREAIAHLAGQADWAALGWPALIDALMALGRADIPLSRLTEGHIDAMRILAEARVTPIPGALYGVWASQSGGTRLTGRCVGGTWHLRGELRFASGAGLLDQALVPVWPADGTHVLLDADVAGWPFDATDWRTRAMERTRSHRVTLDDAVSARRIGGDDFYLQRWGFFAGGVGVAAVWTGGAARVLDLLRVPEPIEPAKAVRRGRARAALATAVALVRQSALALRDRRDQHDQQALQARPDQRPGRESPETVASLCRAGVGEAVRRVLAEARAIAGPAGMAFDEEFTRALDDLTMYVAQQSEDGDAARLGAAT